MLYSIGIYHHTTNAGHFYFTNAPFLEARHKYTLTHKYIHTYHCLMVLCNDLYTNTSFLPTVDCECNSSSWASSTTSKL